MRAGPAGLLVGLGLLACASADTDLHARLQRARLAAELSCGRPTIFASEPPGAGALESRDWRGLLAAAATGAPHERWRAIELLGEFGGPRAAPALLAALADPRGTVRPCLAARSLGRLGDPRAVGALVEAARDPGNEDLRLCAIKSLGLLRSRQAVPVLIDALERRDMVVATAFALARIGDPRGAEAVAQAAGDPELVPWLVGPLGEVGLPQVRPRLRAIAESPRASRFSRREAREGLFKLPILARADRADALAAVLSDDPEPARRAWAAWRMGDDGFEESAAALAAALSDPSDRVRLAAAAALLRLGPASERALLARVDAPGPAARYAVAALGLAGTERSRTVLAQIETPPARAEIARASLRWLRLRGALDPDA